MNNSKFHYLVDWCVIVIFLFMGICTTTNGFLWGKFTWIAPVYIFFALCLLFFNRFSIRHCFQTKEKEFFLMCTGIVLSGINILIIKSHLGAFLTSCNFLLVLYLANKHICFDKKQVGIIAFTSFLILCYWLFINREVYGNVVINPNHAALYIFIHFCVFLCCGAYLLPSVQISARFYHIALLLFVLMVAIRIQSFHCRGVLLAVIAWAVSYFLLPKKKYTILLFVGFSLFMPLAYVLLWKSGMVDDLTVLGKDFASGRDIIWYEFFKAFIRYPITGIGSDFDKMVPDLYLKEVHHALLDLLFVHGIPVFLIALYLMYKRMEEIIACSSGLVRDVCLASIYGMIIAGSFENYYIVSPYNALFLIMFIIAYAPLQDHAIKER